MKKQFLNILLILGLVGSVKAQIVLEPFDYPAGPLVGAPGSAWTEHSAGTTLDVINTASDSGSSLSFPGLGSSLGNRVQLIAAGGQQDVGLNFPAQVANDGDNLYASFLVKHIGFPGTNGGSYFLHFFNGAGATNFIGRVFAEGVGTSNVHYGVGYTTIPTFDTTLYPTNTTRLIVLKYSRIAGATNDTASLFIDPVPGNPEPAPNVVFTNSTTVDVTDIQRVGLRQASFSGTLELDELRVGTNWVDVFSTNAPPVVVTNLSTNIVTIVAAANGSEQGTNGVFTVNSTGTNFPITVTYTVGGNATLVTDYDFLAPATSSSIVLSTSTTNIEIVPVNDGDTNEINPEDVIITLDANGPGWAAGTPNVATVQIFEDVITNQPPTTNEGSANLTGFQLILKGGFKPGKVPKWKSAKGISPLKGPKGQIATTSNIISGVAYALIVDSGTNISTNALSFITAGSVKAVTKGPLFKKQNVKAKFKATKTSKLGIGTPVGTTSVKLVTRINGTSGSNTGSQYFTNTYTTVVK